MKHEAFKVDERKHAHTHTHTHTHTRTHARTYIHTHTHITHGSILNKNLRRKLHLPHGSRKNAVITTIDRR